MEAFTEVLTQAEIQILSELDVALLTTGITFSRKLSETEMRKVCWVLMSVKDRTSDDRINWAIGDWANTVEEWFGKKVAESLIVENQRLNAYREHLLKLTGATLLRVQKLEYTINLCCSFLSLKTER